MAPNVVLLSVAIAMALLGRAAQGQLGRSGAGMGPTFSGSDQQQQQEQQAPFPSSRDVRPVHPETLEWKYTLPVQHLRRAAQNCCGARVVRVLEALERGDDVTIAVVGGSFSLPDRISMDSVWFTQVIGFLQRRYPQANITAVNAAIGGSAAGIAYLCLNNMLPHKVDLVFMDYTPNMGSDLEMVRKSLYLEKLIRALLQHDGNPAIVGIEQLLPANHLFWETAEVTNTVLYRYYDMPWISVGSSIYNLAAANASGFQPFELRVRDAVKGPFHYSARGHKYVADMVVHFFRQADAMRRSGLLDGQTDIFVDDNVQGLASVAPKDASGQEMQPRPSMLPALLHPIRTPLKCTLSQDQQQYVVKHDGWELAADDPNGRKFGYISLYGAKEAPKPQPPWKHPNGEVLPATIQAESVGGPQPTLQFSWVPGELLRLSSRAAAGGKEAGGGPQTFAFLLAYLISYEHMGIAKMECTGGCSCNPQNINARTKDKLSITRVHPMVVSVPPGASDKACIVSVTNVSPGGEHSKFKVTGFIVAEMHPGKEKDIGMANFIWSAGGINKHKITAG